MCNKEVHFFGDKNFSVIKMHGTTKKKHRKEFVHHVGHLRTKNHYMMQSQQNIKVISVAQVLESTAARL